MTVLEHPPNATQSPAYYYEDLMAHYESLPKPLSERDRVALYSYAFAFSEMGLLESKDFYAFSDLIGLSRETMNELPI